MSPSTLAEPLPLIVLAGADPRPAALPESGADLHPLEGAKGLDLRVGGRPLIDHLLERVRESGHFDPIFIAGPARVYGETRQGARVIDTDADFGSNIETSVEQVIRECPRTPLALVTCDVLPDLGELATLMDDYHGHAPLDFWFPLVLAPEEKGGLGASAWKPRYRVVPEPGAEARSLLPGHLIIIDPEAARRPLVYRGFNLAYRSRNRGILYRLAFMVSRLVADLVLQDLRKLFALRLPTYAATVLFNGIALGVKLRRGVLTPEVMARYLRGTFIRYDHRRRYPERRGRLPMVSALSLAKDIDTLEEARELARGLGR